MTDKSILGWDNNLLVLFSFSEQFLKMKYIYVLSLAHAGVWVF